MLFFRGDFKVWLFCLDESNPYISNKSEQKHDTPTKTLIYTMNYIEVKD